MANACFDEDGFSYGIYTKAVKLTTADTVTSSVYSLFWGFQQIRTLAGNQVPSYFVWEVLFTMEIIGQGLLLFALLIVNMHNFLQSLGWRYYFLLSFLLLKCSTCQSWLKGYRGWFAFSPRYCILDTLRFDILQQVEATKL
ncbi:probable cyclic nucleotide-gated ion channel 20, chloroplastic isoform X1 [Prunus dulcis]|uniref:probable cyclic nucleotide-gated ion channel 20, chloroplastic isoform X1 n=1 Tax=Prunus dulcis TaxID=3755 RepID=UPI001483B481|nr:probable cyclic nucleotide-gated ion channel 20, chloroplastic isoform X1 [Prunus dulcis]XP_034219966.1 probable cyclic nucleotide-gated ion channel 20, chloroplastic isoform X1 [Prunus dulcis]